MSDANYSTRLRNHTQILPPRRLRQSPDPPQRQPRLSKQRISVHHPSDPPPAFPPPGAAVHPDDATNKTFLAIGRAMLSIDNRAITIKDLSYLVREHGLACQNVSAASQAITTFIRNHLQRCHQDGSTPLLNSIALTGIRERDDPLAPALHSRSGGTSSSQAPPVDEESVTKFRKGTTVWYLSETVGAPCPFTREGLSVDDITAGSLGGTKRKRDSRPHGPRKIAANAPSMATRHRVYESLAPQPPPPRPRIKLTLRVREPEAMALSDSDSQSEASDSDSKMSVRARRYSETSSETSDDSSSEVESSMDLDDSDRESSEDISGYPFTPNIPSPSYSTPLTSVASPTVACPGHMSAYLKSSLCSSHLIKNTFSTFRTAWSNTSGAEIRARDRSLPFSAASPPDSEDEDEDYHNSMVGLRRDSTSIPMKEEEDSGAEGPMFAPVEPRYVPGGVHFAKPPRSDASEGSNVHIFKQEDSESVSTPLETLPGFLEPSIIKDEPTSAILPPDAWNDVHIKLEELSPFGTAASPVVVDDVEVLGPETVRIREWDAAWGSSQDEMDMDILDIVPPSPPPSEHPCDSPVCMSSFDQPPLSIDLITIDNIALYRTFLGPNQPLFRRVDNSHINLTPLLAFLNLSLAALLMHVTAPRMTVSFADGPLGGTWVPLTVANSAIHPYDAQLPHGLRDVFFSTNLHLDLEKGMSSCVERSTTPELVDESESAGDPVGEYPQHQQGMSLRVEDLFAGERERETSCTLSAEQEVWWDVHARQEAHHLGMGIINSGGAAPAMVKLDEQEERIFYSLVDVLGPVASSQGPSRPAPAKLTIASSTTSSPLSTPPSSPTFKFSSTTSNSNSNASTTPPHLSQSQPQPQGQDKENTAASAPKRPTTTTRRKRDVPIRRSTRTTRSNSTCAAQNTRSRTSRA